MKKYFLVKVKFEQVSEIGSIEKVSQQHLVDALSFTEAETRIIEEMKPFLTKGGEFEVANINPQKINEIFYNDSGEKWFKAKVNFISLNEENGKEKKTAVNMLAQANDVKDAEQIVKAGMNGTLADYEIASISETKILEVFNYKAE